MGSWTLRDAKNHVFKFPLFSLSAGSSAKVWTRAGVNDAENLFWGRRSAISNNTGDKAVLRDQNGVDVARYAY
jgi:competence protein ComEC